MDQLAHKQQPPNESQILQLKTVHNNYLMMGETKALVKNINLMRVSVIDKILVESTLNNCTDSQIRMLCAQAKGITDVISFITKKYESII